MGKRGEPGSEKPETTPAKPAAGSPRAAPGAIHDRSTLDDQARNWDARNIPADRLAPPNLSLPRGGNIRGLGEAFKVNAANGTGSVHIPLPLPEVRELQPTLALGYDSGSPNGAFGLGWSMSLPSVSRKTDKGIPRYRDDGADSDIFQLSGEDLVPAIRADDTPDYVDRNEGGTGYRAYRYRCRVESAFSRIERWVRTADGDTHWRMTCASNMVRVFGDTAASRIADPARPGRIFSWLLTRLYDDRGNLCLFDYAREDRTGVANALHERNRSVGAQLHPKRIRYAFDAPYDPASGTLPPLAHCEILFDYGDHDEADPEPAPDRPWSVRPDPHSSHRSGFEIRTYRLCRRLLFYHRFAELGAAPVLVRSVAFEYSGDDPAKAELSRSASLLQSVTITGHLHTAAGITRTTLPPTRFDYVALVFSGEVKTLDRASAANLPEGLPDGRSFFVDLDGEGIAGALFQQSGAWLYKRGAPRYDPVGDAPPSAGFAPLTPVDRSPPGLTLGKDARLFDVTGSGRLSVVTDGPDAGFFERDDECGWRDFHAFRSNPRLAFADPAIQLLDVDGDGLTDAMRIGDRQVSWWKSLGAQGSTAQIETAFESPLASAPRLVRGDPREAVFIADMSGDGLGDIVRVGNGRVTYWPNLGHGRFGGAIEMSDAPVFDRHGRFEPRRLKLGDLDGSGTTDLVYLHPDRVELYRNQAGNSFAPPVTIPGVPTSDSLASVALIDLLGTGTPCLVWSSPHPQNARAPLRYIDLLNSRRPNLLARVDNGLGLETRLDYVSSTKFYLADRDAGRPWLTKLPFPVQVVERIEAIDHICGARLVSSYSYHHGFYDPVEREFRGFGRVEQRDAQSVERFAGMGGFTETPETVGDEFRLTPVRTVSWFHTGVHLGRERVASGFAAEYWQGDAAAARLVDTSLDPGLSGEERREACRALKGLPLRVEVYADDGSALANAPYVVTEHAYELRRLQRAADGRHAVFFPHLRETLNAHYERDAADPRIHHELNVKVDAYGHVERRAQVTYARRPTPGRLPEQSRLVATVAEQSFRNVDDKPDWHRLGMPIAQRVWEVAGLTATGPDGHFTQADFGAAFDALTEAPMEDELAGTGRRLVHAVRTYYRSDALDARLPLGQVESRALGAETLTLAMSAGLFSRLYSGLATAADMALAGYVKDGGTDWWVPSGRSSFSPNPSATPAQELAEARAHFFRPRRFYDPFGGVSSVDYAHDMFAVRLIDPVGNETLARPHYRVLAPDMVTDANGNRIAARFDPLGIPSSTYVLGLPGDAQGDIFDDSVQEDAPTDAPSSIFRYDLRAWADRGEPVSSSLFVRERYRDPTSPWRQSLSYHDGFGREALTKIHAEPGEAPLRDAGGKLVRGADGKLVFGPVADRWIGSGKDIFDGKGRRIKSYEPFFDSGPQFVDEADLVETGVTEIARYDPLGRIVRTDLPDGTFSTLAFSPWLQSVADGNDNVLGSRWYTERGAPAPTDPEPVDPDIRAAWLAAKHAGTPTRSHADVLGRIVRVVADLGDDPGGGPRRLCETRSVLDAAGNLRALIDALGRTIARYENDMLGRRLKSEGMDGDGALELIDVSGKPVRRWSDSGHAVRWEFDAAQRPIRIWLSKSAGPERLIERTIYGEAHPDASRNLNGQVFRHYDAGGLTENRQFDFKGRLREAARRFAGDYHGAPAWDGIAALTDAASLDAATATLLEADVWRRLGSFDALDQPIQTVTPHRSGDRPNVIQPRFNRAGLLESVDIWIRRSAAPTGLLAAGSADRRVIAAIEYDARGQRLSARFDGATPGLKVESRYRYDALTYRLTELVTSRIGGTFAANARKVQQLSYTFDAVGNIVEIRDDAQPAVFFRNRRVDPTGWYEYDAGYRLIAATGREHLGLVAGKRPPPAQPGPDDGPRTVAHPHDGDAVGTYTEYYDYDDAGNFRSARHVGEAGAGWTRLYAYDAASALEPTRKCNRLTATSLPGDPLGGPYGDRFAYDVHGNLSQASHLSLIEWDHADRMTVSARQSVGPGLVPETTWYGYSDRETRTRKTTERARSAGDPVSILRDRRYFGEFEILTEFASDGTPSLIRETLHVHDGGNRIALVETKTLDVDDPTDVGIPLLRRQHANHIGTAVLELDDDARVVCYEEFFPFGGTAFLILSAAIRGAARRYRYTSKEKDEETGFYFFGARYYAPWLGRWISCDPSGPEEGTNVYVYVGNSPVQLFDPNGRWDIDWTAVGKGVGIALVGAVVGVIVVAAVVSTGGAAAVAVATWAGATATTAATVGAVTEGVIIGGAAAYGAYGAAKNVKSVATGRDSDTGAKLTDKERSERLGTAVVDVAALGLGARGLAKKGGRAKMNRTADQAMIDNMAARKKALPKMTPEDQPGAATLAEARTPSGAKGSGRSSPRSLEDPNNRAGTHAERDALNQVPKEDGTTLAVDQMPCEKCDPHLEAVLPPGSRVIVPHKPGAPIVPRSSPGKSTSIRPMVKEGAAKGETLVPRLILMKPLRPSMSRTLPLAVETPVYGPAARDIGSGLLPTPPPANDNQPPSQAPLPADTTGTNQPAPVYLFRLRF